MGKPGLILLGFGLSAFAQEDPAVEKVLEFQARLRKLVQEVRPAFVFIGGGSGVCISADGWVLTNHHVAGPTGRAWEVRLTGGRKYSAVVVGHDPAGDLSLLKIQNAAGLPHLPLGDSDALKIGDHVIAIGNPFLLGNGKGARNLRGMGRTDGGWEPTTTLGIISALHRYQDWYMDAIQTDCPVNPGNSGGPLINLKGEVVGIVGRIAMRFGLRVNTGIGFAIPSNQVRNYLGALKAGGRVWHGYVDGITIADAGNESYENTGEYGDGVVVIGVDEGTPASHAGFRPGDLITEIQGKRVWNGNRFHGIVGTYPQGTTVSVTVRRKGEDGRWEEVVLKVWLGDPRKFKPPWK